MLKHLNIIVSGKVQGVYYRVYLQTKAQKLGLYGFVCNRPNGNVYIEAEGEDTLLKELVEWCRTGSPNAIVSKVEVFENEIRNFTDFIIKK